jgi:hypothetical protein
VRERPQAKARIQLMGDGKMKRTTLLTLALAAFGFAGSALAGDDVLPPAQLPEPGVLALLAVGVVAAVAVRLRGRK